MDDEPKTAAEMKEIRLNRKLAQDAEGIKAMADIAAADIAIRKRTANLRAIRAPAAQSAQLLRREVRSRNFQGRAHPTSPLSESTHRIERARLWEAL